MSAAHSAHDASDHHDEHAFDGEPIRVLPDDEPKSPMWLPLLGLALFGSALTFLLITSDGSAAEGAARPVAAEKTAAVAKPTATTAPVPAARPTSSAAALSSAIRDAMQRDPARVKEMQRQLLERTGGRAVPPGSPVPPPPAPPPAQPPR